MNFIWKRKGSMSLQMIVVLIILLVLAVVVISLILQFINPSSLKTLEKPMKRAQIISQCKMECNKISGADSLAAKQEAAFNYCTKHFYFDTSSGEGTLTSNIYIEGTGVNAFCVDHAYCFNFPDATCRVDGTVLDAKACRDLMCTRLISEGLTKTQAEENIKNKVPAGNCNLHKAAHKEILVPTWWEEYFENPNCSMASGNNPNHHPNPTGCVSFCQGKGHSGATESGCIGVTACNAPNIPIAKGDGAPCTDMATVCCCTP